MASAAADMNRAVSNLEDVFSGTKDLWMIG
jgi:hypothetical protein